MALTKVATCLCICAVACVGILHVKASDVCALQPAGLSSTCLPFSSRQQLCSGLLACRADSIVADAEVVREALVAKGDLQTARWTLLGQSFGGFCAVQYLSVAPQGQLLTPSHQTSLTTALIPEARLALLVADHSTMTTWLVITLGAVQEEALHICICVIK